MSNTPNMHEAFDSGAGNQSKWSGYYLIRSYHKDAGPYDVVTDLSSDEAIATCESKEPGRGREEQTAADGTRDQNGYMQMRIKTENWLRENAREAGVDMQKQNPVYFAFTREPERFTETMAKRRQDTKTVIFRAEELDLSNWSFTMDDHFFADHDNGAEGTKELSGFSPHPLHGRVLSAEQLLAAIEEHGYPENEMTHNFEAQMWAPEPTLLKDPDTAPSASSSSGLQPIKPV